MPTSTPPAAALLPWLFVLGIGEQGFAALPAASQTLAAECESIFGAARHVRTLPSALRAKSQCWQSPLSLSLAALDALRLQREKICVLATGDPLSFGIGTTLVQRYSIAEVRIVPHLGSFSLAAAALGWGHDSIQYVSLHGRPLATLKPWLEPAVRPSAHAPPRRLFVMLDGDSTPARIARLLGNLGFAATQMHVFSRLGSKDEQHFSSTAQNFPPRRRFPLRRFPPPSLLALALPSCPSKPLCRKRFGMPEQRFVSDGLITKSEVRTITLAALAPARDALLWDIGAGSGSISIEWCLAGGRAIAVERNAKRAANLRKNVEHFGLIDRIALHYSEALEFLAEDSAPLPDSIFLGGSVEMPLAERLIDRLDAQGRFVANAVTKAAESALYELHSQRGGTLSRIAVQRLTALANGAQAFLPLTPILHYVLQRD